jgi:hypothetical protein
MDPLLNRFKQFSSLQWIKVSVCKGDQLRPRRQTRESIFLVTPQWIKVLRTTPTLMECARGPLPRRRSVRSVSRIETGRQVSVMASRAVRNRAACLQRCELTALELASYCKTNNIVIWSYCLLLISILLRVHVMYSYGFIPVRIYEYVSLAQVRHHMPQHCDWQTPEVNRTAPTAKADWR